MSEDKIEAKEPAERHESDKSWNRLSRWSLVLSGLWIFVWLVTAFVSNCKLYELKLDEAADFWAGMAAPLAFYWLVLGFYQQGRHLRLQADEMRQSVAQFSAQTDIMDKQLKLASRRERDRELISQLTTLQPRIHKYFFKLLTDAQFYPRDGGSSRRIDPEVLGRFQFLEFSDFCAEVIRELIQLDQFEFRAGSMSDVERDFVERGLLSCIEQYNSIYGQIDETETPRAYNFLSENDVPKMMRNLRRLASQLAPNATRK